MVWRRRLILILAIVVLVAAYYIHLDRRVAHLRTPEAALGPGSQVYRDLLYALQDPSTQLTLQATIYDFGRYGSPGPMRLQHARGSSSGRLWISVSSYGTIGETGAPVIYPGGDYQIEAHSLNLFGRVREVIVRCRYVVCWDRKAREGRVLDETDDLPDLSTPEMVDHLPRYSNPELVTDVLRLQVSTASMLWQPSSVERIETSDYLPVP